MADYWEKTLREARKGRRHVGPQEAQRRVDEQIAMLDQIDKNNAELAARHEEGCIRRAGIATLYIDGNRAVTSRGVLEDVLAEAQVGLDELDGDYIGDIRGSFIEELVERLLKPLIENEVVKLCNKDG